MTFRDDLNSICMSSYCCIASDQRTIKLIKEHLCEFANGNVKVFDVYNNVYEHVNGFGVVCLYSDIQTHLTPVQTWCTDNNITFQDNGTHFKFSWV